MEQNENYESPQHDRRAAFDWENWDGQDASVPDPPAEPDPFARFAESGWQEPGAEVDDDETEAPSPAAGLSAAPPPAEPPARWSEPPPHVPAPEDSGFYYRNGRPIPPTHPDHGPMHLIPRQEDGSFAAFIVARRRSLACMRNPAHRPAPHGHCEHWEHSAVPSRVARAREPKSSRVRFFQAAGKPNLTNLSKLHARQPRQTARSTSSFLVSAIALAGLSPLGQTLAQFMIVWQR
jgi:hypothetical protein